MSEAGLTTAAIIRYSESLEDDSSAFYETLAERWPEHKEPFLTFAKRGFDTVITFYGEKDLSRPPCQESLACAEVCPVGAIIPKNDQESPPP